MENFIYYYNTFIEEYWSFCYLLFWNKLPDSFEVYHVQALSIVTVFLVTFLLSLLLKCAPKIYTSQNGEIFKSTIPAYILKFLTNFNILYVFVCVPYILIQPLYWCTTEEIVRNIPAIIIITLVILYMFFSVIFYDFFEERFENGKLVYLYGYLCCTGLLLLCRMISSVYYEYAESGFILFATIRIFASLSVVNKIMFSKISTSTIWYFKNKDKKDIEGLKKIPEDVIREVKKVIPVVEQLNGTRIESLEDVECLEYYKKLLPETPMAWFSNDEYYNNMRTLYPVSVYENSYEKGDYIYNSFMSELNSAFDFDFGYNFYEKNYKYEEAIAKIFDQLGYQQPPTLTNFVKLGQTLSFIGALYSYKATVENNKLAKCFNEEYPIISRGVEGELIVSDFASKMKERHPDMKFFQNFRFYYADDSSAECDLLIITKGGVFCVEVKNYGQDANYILEISANGTWYKRYGEHLHQIDSDPFRQNHMHAEAIVQRFGKELAKLTDDGSIPPVYELVVVPNNIEIHNDSMNKVLHIGGLQEFILTEAKKFDGDKVDEVAETISKAAVPPIKYERIDFAKWNKEIERIRYYGNNCNWENIYRSLEQATKYKIIK